MKYKLKDFLIILYFISIGIIPSFLVTSYSSIEYGGMLSNRFYTSQAISFIITDTDAGLDEILPAIQNAQILWKELETNTRGIYFKEDVTLPIQSGQSLDFEDPTPQMVKGRESEYTLEGFVCKGYLGVDRGSALNSYTFYSLPEIIQMTGISGKWVLDGKDIEHTFHEIEEIIGKDKLVRTTNTIRGYFRAYNPVPTEQFYLSIILLLMGASCLITVIFLKREYKLLRICNVIGVPLKNIFRRYIVQGIFLFGIAEGVCMVGFITEPPFLVFGKTIDATIVASVFLPLIFLLVFISGGITVRYFYDMERN